VTSTTEWRLSGKDGYLHAFRSDGGYITPQDLVSLGFPGSAAAEDVVGPYEGFIAECGHIVPTAMLLPCSAGESCLACLTITGVVALRKATRGNAHRDLSTMEPPPARPERQVLRAL
jgi:hypothetical protein